MSIFDGVGNRQELALGRVRKIIFDAIKLGFELFHRHGCLNSARKPRKISRPRERSGRGHIAKQILLNGPQEKQIKKNENDGNNQISQADHDHWGLFLQKCRLLDKLAVTFKRNVLDGELIATGRIESDGGRDQVFVLFHFVGISRFLCCLRLTVTACRQPGVVVDEHRNGYVIHLPERIDVCRTAF